MALNGLLIQHFGHKVLRCLQEIKADLGEFLGAAAVGLSLHRSGESESCEMRSPIT